MSGTHALKFISGKYQGGEFPLKAEKQIVIGRSSELDMVLIEDMVSCRHASIGVAGDEISIADVGSTGRSFNGRARATNGFGGRAGFMSPRHASARRTIPGWRS